MQPETPIKTEGDAGSPDSNINVSGNKEGTGAGRAQSNTKTGGAQNGATNAQFPPPKTDKPRPHVCGTCGRSFARLEHLKRHERSHTKEKPFECPECTRCFARRDLLLRHQQKLHMTNTTSSRPRSGRRESVSGTSVAGGRVRKNSIATGSVGGSVAMGTPTHRPRANTISHIDLSGLGFLDGPNPSFSRMNALGITSHSMGMGGLPGPMNFDYRGMSNTMGHHGNHSLPKLDMHSVNNMDIGNSLRTAPPQASFGGFDIDSLFSPGTTVNPAQLHFGGAASATQQHFPPLEPFTVHSALDHQGQVDDFGWMRNWNIQMNDGNEQAVDESSPSRMSSGESPGDYSESMNNSTSGIASQANFQWPQQAPQSIPNGPFQLDALGTGLPKLENSQETVSPINLHDPTPTNDSYLQQAILAQQQQHQHQHQPEIMQGQAHNFFAPSVSNFNSDSPSISTSSMSARQSSVTSMSTDSITEATRQALLMSLSQSSNHAQHHRTYSQPTISSPLSPGAARGSTQGPNLPSTADIRRYVEAFIQFAHPHLPFLHTATLSFDAIELGIKGGSPSISSLTQNGAIVGGGCLLLAMAAIGALYEYDHPASKDLFDAARKMIQVYMEERRKADMSAAVNGASPPSDGSQQTPLWLVQAMLLNVVYGHQCGDKNAADVASNNCNALVSLARSAQLAQPPTNMSADSHDSATHNGSGDVEMRESSLEPGDSRSRHQSADTDLRTQWLTWKLVEERKRTFFAIFILSSLLTTAYNHTPTIMNSEIMLDLPCDEELWSAETAQEWQNRGGLAAAEQNAVTFAGALSTLLTANQRNARRKSSAAINGHNHADALADSELRPSTFGCLVLINALHNYIWETRSRHHGRQWTAQETESMFSHIEPALTAWQSAWKANAHHTLDRPNPFGMGPLSADSIPLLDLAFVRLFVNLGRSKEAFWQRNFDGMAEELAHGSEIVQHAEPSPMESADRDLSNGMRSSASASPPNAAARRQSQASFAEQASSRRERHLRKAAFYAADSLSIACRVNLTYSDLNAHELPVQSAMCFFDCSQVLAEWACTVQERVGRYLGVLGRDSVEFCQVPAIMMLQTEDVELLGKIQSICENMEAKRLEQENMFGGLQHQLNPVMNVNGNLNLGGYGYGSRILRITALMLEKAVVWPVTHVMAKALETQAAHMDQRAAASTLST